MIAAAKAIGYDRASFDRCEQLRVQPTVRRATAVAPYLRARLRMIRLTSTLKDGRLRGFFAI
jgi:hypothetical protein